MEPKEKAKALPDKPGVYIMKNNTGSIIYIGKAKVLRNRAGQYFQKSGSHPPKILRMVQEIRDIEYIVTDTEIEALLLECKLIKEIKPYYNKLMKSESRYVFISINIGDDFPAVEITEECDSRNLCFGPYTSSRSAENAVKALIDFYKLRSCRGVFKGSSGCLRLQLGQCGGPCTGSAAKEGYAKQINRAVDFLSGKDKSTIKQLERQMHEAAEQLDFHKAAKLRDDIYSLKHIINKQKAKSFTDRNRNIAVIEQIGNRKAKLLIISGTKLAASQILNIDELNERDFAGKIKTAIEDFIAHNINNSFETDKENIDKAQIIYSYLKNKKSCSYMVLPKSRGSCTKHNRLQVSAEMFANKALKHFSGGSYEL